MSDGSFITSLVVTAQSLVFVKRMIYSNDRSGSYQYAKSKCPTPSFAQNGIARGKIDKWKIYI